MFVYKYVFDNIGILNYKIISDLDIIKSYVDEDTIVIMNWSSSIHYAYLNNNEIVVNKFNNGIINRMNKKNIIIVGDTPFSNSLNNNILYFEDQEKFIFNMLKE